MIAYWSLPQRVVAYSSLSGLVLVLAGCVNYVGINNKQHLAKPEQFSTQKSIVSGHGKWPSIDWARQFDVHLPSLINEAVANNPDLQISIARQKKAKAQVDGRNAALLPKVDFLGLLARNKTIFPPTHAMQNFTLSALNFSYELDFWEKNYSLLTKALSEEKVSQAALYESSLMIATMVASTYNQLDYEYHLQDVLLQTARQRKNLNSITNKLFKSGLATEVQVYQARNAYADVETQLVAIDGQIKVTRQQLGVLLGAGPDRGFAIPKPKMSWVALPKLPDNLPVNLLGRRPDVVAARWQVEASLQAVKNVKSQFYPNINLFAIAANFTFGTQALFRTSDKLSGIASALYLPIFDGGILRAKLKGQYAVLDEQIGLYNSTLNKALGDVAEQLTLIQTIDNQLKAQNLALSAAQHALFLAQKQYEFGLTSQIVVLNAQTRYLEEQEARLQLIKTRRDLQIALIKALGGGFDECFLKTPRTTASPNRLLKRDAHV